MNNNLNRQYQFQSEGPATLEVERNKLVMQAAIGRGRQGWISLAVSGIAASVG